MNRFVFWSLIMLTLLVSSRADGQNTAAVVIVDEASGVRYTVEPFVSANFPTGLAFAPDGRLFYNEKNTGNVRVVSAEGERQPEPVISVSVDGSVERGLLGIALDPDYETNGHIWIVYTAAGTARDWPANTIARFTEHDGMGDDLEILLTLPIDNGVLIHNGGNIRFDDAGRLFYSIGDYGEAWRSQDIESPQGAIHRFEVTDDGLLPAEGNPFGDDNSIYAVGFRNPYDIWIDPISGQVWTTENGPQCDDQINLVLMGFNYGWREDYRCSGYSAISDVRDYMPPLINFDQSIGMVGLTIYESDAIPEWENDLFFCDWTFGEMRRAEIDESRSRVNDVHMIDLGGYECKLGIITGPDGALYFGSVGGGDGAIYRLAGVAGE